MAEQEKEMEKEKGGRKERKREGVISHVIIGVNLAELLGPSLPFPFLLGIFCPNFTRLLYVPIYARLQIFI